MRVAAYRAKRPRTPTAITCNAIFILTRRFTRRSIARVQLARKIAAVARAKIFVACYVQRVGRGFMGRQRVYRIIRMRLEKAASTKIQAVARMFIATNYFIDSITDIIIAQSVVRGYIVRCDPASFKESLIAAQMEVEREELIHRANMAKAQEIEAEKRAIEVLEFEAAAAVGKTPLFFAIEGGDWPRVNTIIASGESARTKPNLRGAKRRAEKA